MRSIQWIGVICAAWIALWGGCGKHTELEGSARARDGGEDAVESSGTTSSPGHTGTPAGRSGALASAGANAAGAMAPPPPDCIEL
jgi:hypothetical protein